MRVHVDAFGCQPDGRLLRQVSIQPGSFDLLCADGTLRPSDVGKFIAIPGGIDLVAIISAPLDPSKEVTSVSMTAGSPMLAAVLTTQDGFFHPRVHGGLRITVAGAADGGQLLITDVLRVVDRTTLELALPASTSVHDAAAKLNPPDRVELGDYARTSATGVTIDLQDRVVSDAAVTVGRHVLQSETAKFSSADLGKQVTIRAAGCLVTTIQQVIDSSHAQLAAPAQRQVAAGTADVWRADSTPGFQNLIAVLDTVEVEQAEICFSPGVYDFSRIPTAPGSLPAAISIKDRSDITLRGCGQGVTVLRLMPNQDPGTRDTNVVDLHSCHRVTIRDLTVHGAYLTQKSVSLQSHGIRVNEGCTDIAIDQVEVFQSAGDGIRLVGSPTANVRRVWVDQCRLTQNRRTGIAVQRGIAQLWVRACYIEMTPPSSGACLDLEPTGAAAPTDITIDSNVMIHGTPAVAVSLSGIKGTDPAQRIRLTHNTLHGGGIGGVHAQDVTIADNTIVAGETGQVAVFRGTFDGLRIEGNDIQAPGEPRDGIRLNLLDGLAANRVRIVNNDISAGGIGVALIDPGSDIEVRGNRITGQGEAIGISVALTKATIGVHRGFRIIGNTLVNFGDAGIHLKTFNTSERFEAVEISSNEILLDLPPGPATRAGIRLARPGNGTDRWVQPVLVTANRIADSIDISIDRDGQTVPFLVIGGNTGSAIMCEGDGNPNGVVTAAPGSLFAQVDTQSPAALFLKTSGDDDSGWVEMAISPP
jgi:hypothetical protein